MEDLNDKLDRLLSSPDSVKRIEELMAAFTADAPAAPSEPPMPDLPDLGPMLQLLPLLGQLGINIPHRDDEISRKRQKGKADQYAMAVFALCRSHPFVPLLC